MSACAASPALASWSDESGDGESSLRDPIRIGNATVMPGDVVFGDREGVYFVPPYLVEQIVNADELHIHDEWTQMMLRTGKYKSSEIYPTPGDPELKKQYDEYKKKKLAELNGQQP
jgi:hypothetical protein